MASILSTVTDVVEIIDSDSDDNEAIETLPVNFDANAKSVQSTSAKPYQTRAQTGAGAAPVLYQALALGLGGDGEDATREELKKLRLEETGKFMKNFDPERSEREIRKMKRKINSNKPKKNAAYDNRGILVANGLDLCDCLDKDCPGCHFPCARCGSEKCGIECRVNRKYIIDHIEVEGTDVVYSFVTS